MMIMSKLHLRSNIVEVIDVYGTIIGAVPLQLLCYHVNNNEKFKHTGFSREEVLDELSFLEDAGEIEKTDAWIIKEKPVHVRRK